MADAVRINFVADGVPELGRVFDSLEARIVRFEKTASQQSQAGTRERVRIAKDEEKEREAAYVKLAREADKWQREETRTAEREARTRSVATEQEAQRASRVFETTARAQIRYAEEVTHKLAQEEEKRHRNQMRTSEKYIGALKSGTGSMVAGAASMGIGLATGATAFMVADVVHERMRSERSAALLVNAVTTGKTPPAGATVKNILARAGAVAVETGMDKDTIVQASLGYARSAKGGDFKGVMENMGFFAKMAKVTGADMSQITGAAGTLQSQNPNIDSGTMQQMLLGAYAASKTGSLSMTQQAEQMGKAGSMASAFQGDMGTNQRKLMGLMQLVAPRSPDSAGMFIMDFAKEVSAHRMSTGRTQGTQALGVKFDKFGRMESPEQAIEALIKSSGGDFGKIDKLLGSRGGAVFDSLRQPFVDGQAKGGMAGGLKAVRAAMDTQTAATMSTGDLQAQFQQSMSTSAEKFDAAVEKIKDALENRLEPWLEKFSDKLPELLPKLESIIDGAAKLADFFLSNPFIGLGSVVAMSVAKDIAGAAIGTSIKALLTNLLAGTVSPASAASYTAPGAAAAGGLVPKLLGGTALVASGVGLYQQIQVGREAGSATESTIAALTAAPTSSVDAKAKAAAIQKLLAGSKDVGRFANDMAVGANPIAGAVSGIGSLFGVKDAGGGAAAAGRLEEARVTRTHTKELEDALKKLVVVVNTAANGVASASQDPSHPSRHNPIDQRATPR